MAQAVFAKVCKVVCSQAFTGYVKRSFTQCGLEVTESHAGKAQYVFDLLLNNFETVIIAKRMIFAADQH